MEKMKDKIPLLEKNHFMDVLLFRIAFTVDMKIEAAQRLCDILETL
jgi:hypothetical protein